MRRLLMAGAQAKIPASYMHPGYLDWDTHCPPDEQENRRNLLLWESVEEIRQSRSVGDALAPRRYFSISL